MSRAAVPDQLELHRFADAGNPHHGDPPAPDHAHPAAPAGEGGSDLAGAEDRDVQSVKDLISQTAALADQRTAANETAYRQLVRECAGPNPPSPERILEKLRKLDRDVEEFQAALELHSRRVELRAEYDQLTARHRRRAAIADQVAEAEAVCRAKIQAAEEELAAVVDPLHREDAELKGALERSQKAGAELAATCPYPEVRAGVAAAEEEVRRAVRRRSEVMDVHGGATAQLLIRANGPRLPGEPAEVAQIREQLPAMNAEAYRRQMALEDDIRRARRAVEEAVAKLTEV